MAGTRYLLRLAIAGVLLLSASVAFGAEWMRYQNPRFGTAVDVPLTGFIANSPPDSGDGQIWTSADGAGQLMVYGTLIVTVDNFRAYRKYTLGLARDESVDITYSAGKRNWFVYSGYQGNSIVYEKVVLTRGCSSLIANHLYLKYPIVQKKRYDPIVRRMSKSLAASRSGSICN